MSTLNNLILILGLILTILNIGNMSFVLKDRSQTPREELKRRVDRLEAELDEIRSFLAKDKERISDLEKGNKVLLKSMGALLSHGIDGNNLEEMKLAREELNLYLIEK